MDGYRLRSAHGDTIDPRQPLPTDSVEAQETIAVSSTFTYNGKAAAGAVSIGSLPLKPVIEGLGSRVASYWGDKSNLVYTAFADRSQNKGSNVFLTVTETATAAAITIYDADKNLEEMFESVSGTVKRFVAKVTDTAGGVLYGWIRGVSVSGSVYTFEIMNARLAETQSWVGALGAFTSTSLEKVEIFYYNSSIAFATGTCFTEEVECPKEYSKNRELQLTYAEGLSNGQYFVDYMRGELIGVKADNTASETVTYNVWSSTTGGSGSPATNINVDQLQGTEVNLDDAAFAVGTDAVLPTGFLADETATDSVDEGDTGIGRMTLDRKQITASEFKEDAAHTTGDYGTNVLSVRKDTAASTAGTDGDYATLTTDATGKLWVNADVPSLADDAAFTVATSKVVPVGALADETATDSVDEGDVGAVRMTLDRRLQVKAGTALEGPGNPVIDSYATVAINLTTGANQVLVSSAADKQIWVYGYAFTVGDAAGQTVSLQDEDDTALTGIMEFAQYGGISVPPSGNFAMPVFKLATDKDLEIDITGGDVDGWLAYAIVSV